MSCSPFDLRDYHFGELADPQRREVESHVRNCAPCREELERLQMTESALFTLREEEIPQRIAFVSDPIFEPSRVRRFFSDFWGSAARLGFASAAMLSAALVVFAFHKPAPAPVPAAVPPAVVASAAPSDADVKALVDAAVAKAVGAAEERQTLKTKALAADLEAARQRLLVAAQELDQSQKRQGTYKLNAGLLLPPNENGEVQ
jgi:anti-sigma factor RsiW